MKTKMTNVEINEFIETNISEMSYSEMSGKIGISKEAVRKRAARMGCKLPANATVPLTDKEQIQKDIEKSKVQCEKRDTGKKYKLLLGEVEELRQKLTILEAPREYSANKIIHIEDSVKSEATAVVLLSDFHMEQIVDGRRLAYPNTYNIEIAKQRAEECFIGIVSLLKKEQTHQEINNLIMWLGGDFITGNIHLSELPNLQLGTAEACFLAEETLIRGIEYVLDNTDVKIICPTSCGNHSRITEKVWISSEQDNSVETIIYYHIKKHFEKEKRFELIMPYGCDTFLEVYGLTLAFGHGHAGFKYQGGVGGLYIPVRRTLMRKFNKRQIYLYCLGHFHQFIADTMFIVNGSLIGYDDYANYLGMDYSMPCQVFFLLDKGRKCRTVTTPIVFKI